MIWVAVVAIISVFFMWLGGGFLLVAIFKLNFSVEEKWGKVPSYWPIANMEEKTEEKTEEETESGFSENEVQEDPEIDPEDVRWLEAHCPSTMDDFALVVDHGDARYLADWVNVLYYAYENGYSGNKEIPGQEKLDPRFQLDSLQETAIELRFTDLMSQEGEGERLEIKRQWERTPLFTGVSEICSDTEFWNTVGDLRFS